uniref:Uncharacterized protein n=1 Tax=Lygus hesperus TaxID=30085 RepID=A0A0K8T2F3_LYGHE
MIRVFGVHLIWLLAFSLASAEKPKTSLSPTGDVFCAAVHKLLPTKFYLRTRDHFNLSSATADQEGKIFEDHLEPDKDVVVIIHEYLRGCDKEFVVETTKAYHKTRPEVQIVNVCWSAGLTQFGEQSRGAVGNTGLLTSNPVSAMCGRLGC